MRSRSLFSGLVRSCLRPSGFSTLFLAAAFPAPAQWSRESHALEAGWSGVWVSQDCGYVDIDTLLSGHPEILEVWQWNPLGSTAQFAESPWLPVQEDAAWKVWRRNDPQSSTLGRITGNAGYLVKVADNTPAFSLELTGKPLPPRYEFSTSGSNFVGFPVLEPASITDRSFEKFFSWSEVLKSNPPVFTYRNGTLSAQYPVQALPRSTAVTRGRAYWVKNGTYTDYYGPLQVTLTGSGLDYGASGNLIALRVKNVTDPAKNQSVTFTLRPAPSAAPPAGQPVAVGPVPLRLRGQRDAQTLAFQYEDIPPAGLSRTLAPGQELQLPLAVNRGALTGASGSRFESLLQITDSLNQTRIVLPVSAEVTSLEGLWAGAAVVNTVDQIIGQQAEPNAAAPSPFTVRLLLHRKADGTSTLLQQVYLGEKNGTPLAGVNEAPVKALSTADPGRLSSASFPLSMAAPGAAPLSGGAGTVSFDIVLGHNAPTNPFVHTYHPDHDNLDARFENALPAGQESWTVRRAVRLEFQDSMPGVTDPAWGSTLLGGQYRETLTGLRATPITVTGSFLLHRVSAAAELLTAP